MKKANRVLNYIRENTFLSIAKTILAIMCIATLIFILYIRNEMSIARQIFCFILYFIGLSITVIFILFGTSMINSHELNMQLPFTMQDMRKLNIKTLKDLLDYLGTYKKSVIDDKYKTNILNVITGDQDLSIFNIDEINIRYGNYHRFSLDILDDKRILSIIYSKTNNFEAPELANHKIGTPFTKEEIDKLKK